MLCSGRSRKMPVTSVAKSSSSSAHLASSMLQRGSSGPEVVALQKALAAAGVNPGGADGTCGPQTEAALKAFQRKAGIVVDGRAGAQTWGALNASKPAP